MFERIENPYLRHAVGMLLVGLLIYALFHFFGHYYVEGVGYSTIQALLLGATGAARHSAAALRREACRHLDQPRLRRLGRHFFAVALHGRDAWRRLRASGQHDPSAAEANVATFAIVGMAAMVAGGTGAAMTAVTMIFEMTRDYALVMPMILAVALSIGVRRVLSRENIYTIKLVARRHLIPKALHANMFLVRHANEIMDKDVLVLPAETDFDAFLRQPNIRAR